MKVICINSKGRPAEVPTSQWIKEGEVYTVINVQKMLTQGGLLGFELEEVKINAAMYRFFAASRFAPVDTTPYDELMEELKLVEA